MILETFKKISPYILVAIITLVVASMIVPKLDFLKNSEVKKKEAEIKLLEKENEELLKSANSHKSNSEEYQKESEFFKGKNIILLKDLEIRDKYILVMRKTLDSLDIDINLSDSTLAKIDKEEYEILNNSNNSSINEHKQFFTKLFRTQNNN